MHSTKQLLLVILICTLLNSVHGSNASGQGDEGMELKFAATLKNATLKGTWAKIDRNLWMVFMDKSILRSFEVG